MGSAALFFDGAYVEKLIKFEFNSAAVDFQKLAAEMSGADELVRAYYYNCPRYTFPDATEEDQLKSKKQEGFFRALSYVPRFEVRLGRLALRGVDTDNKPIFEQKKIDTMIGVDMVMLALKGRLSRIALFSGDGDYVPAIQAVKNEGVITTLWHGARSATFEAPSGELFRECDERCVLTAEIVNRIRRT